MIMLIIINRLSSMNRDKWYNIISNIKEKFEIEEEFKGEVGEDIPGEKQTIIFATPMGRFKLEWVEKPRTIGEKTTFARRTGSHIKVEKKYSEDELVNYMKAFKWDGDDWEEIKADVFAG